MNHRQSDENAPRNARQGLGGQRAALPPVAPTGIFSGQFEGGARMKQGNSEMTEELHNAVMRVHYATKDEDRWKSGLEYIGRRLTDATTNAKNAAERILPEVADVNLNPVPALQSLLATPPEWKTAIALPELGELIFKQLQKEIAIKHDCELIYPDGDRRLMELAEDWFIFLFGWDGDSGCRALMQKKIELAQVLSKKDAANKLATAFNKLAPSFKLSDWEKDAKRFANEITPDGFHVAFRTALKLDAEATEEINAADAQKPPKPKRKRTKHIPYKTASAILKKLNCPKDRKTLQRWMQGQNTPDDFTPECMATVQAFSEWAKIYAHREQAKINTNNALWIDNPDSRKMQKFR